jgi:hypothetical protein
MGSIGRRSKIEEIESGRHYPARGRQSLERRAGLRQRSQDRDRPTALGDFEALASEDSVKIPAEPLMTRVMFALATRFGSGA